MNLKNAPSKEPLYLFLLSLITFIEFISSGVITLLIAPDPKNAVIFGFSFLRLLLVVGTWILATAILIAGVIAYKKKISLDSALLVTRRKNLRRLIYAITFALIVWGWLSLFCPPYLFGKLTFVFERIQPFSIALGISLAQAWLFFLFALRRLDFHAPNKSIIYKYFWPTLLFTVIITCLGIFIASTKLGLVADLLYWNVPGIPLSGLQLFLIILLVGLWIAFLLKLGENHPFFRFVNKYRLIPVLIFLTAFLTWGFTPMLRHFFSLEPGAPSYQPFPFSDARVHDLGGISILQGYGVYFYGYTDKPLYMIFLAILHIFAGYNYSILTWLLILVLAFIPVVLFLLGNQFHSSAFGIFLALILIIRQRNAILLSYKISSVNPKLFMTEEMTLLGVALFSYLVFLWIRDRKIWLALLCGGCIGATSLFRMNPLFLFPAAACLIVPVFWGSGKKSLLSHLSVYTLGFLILLVPWIFSGINPEGKPWLLIKFQDVINSRYGRTDPSIQGLMQSSLPEAGIVSISWDGKVALVRSPSKIQELVAKNQGRTLLQNSRDTLQKAINNQSGTIYRFLDHLLHNFSTSVLSLPDSWVYDDLNHLIQPTYWSDNGGWKGHLPLAQTGLVFLNLVLIAIGLGYSWIHHRWAGMIPLVIFITYSLALGAAMNSGGRYIVPIDWVLYFYYGLAIIVIIQSVYKVPANRYQVQHLSPDHNSAWKISSKRVFGFSLAGIIFFASLIPIANFVLPAVSGSTRNQPNVEAARIFISTHQNPGMSIVYGEILYPYYHDNGTFDFDFLTPEGATSYTIIRGPDWKTVLRGGEHVFITSHTDNQGNLQASSIYLLLDAKPLLIWELQP